MMTITTIKRHTDVDCSDKALWLAIEATIQFMKRDEIATINAKLESTGGLNMQIPSCGVKEDTNENN